MQYATKSNHAGLNTRSAARTLARAEQIATMRTFWLREARRSLRIARSWRVLFGGPLHARALGEYLDWLLNAEDCRAAARGERSR